MKQYLTSNLHKHILVAIQKIQTMNIARVGEPAPIKSISCKNKDKK